MGKEHCLDIIQRCEPTEEGRRLKCLGIDGKVLDNRIHSNKKSTKEAILKQF